MVVVGGSVESGWVGTSTGYVQRYITYHYGAGLSIAATINMGKINGNGGYEPTFSDWAGASTSTAFGLFMLGGEKTVGAHYTAWSGSFGETVGLRGLGKVVQNGSGGKSNSWTVLIGTPFIPTADLT